MTTRDADGPVNAPDLRDVEARLIKRATDLYGSGEVDELAWTLLVALRELRAKAQAYLDANEIQAPTAAANLRYELTKVHDDDSPAKVNADQQLDQWIGRVEAVYRALGRIKGIHATCEQHRNYPWQLHCETCRRFVAEELVSLGARIERTE